MSRLCRLRLRRHGDDGQWAYDEIVKQRKQIEELQFALAETEALEMAHGERIEKLTAQVGVLREALSAAKYATRPSITLELIEQALATTPESALSEVRRAERERVAQFVQQGTGDWMLGKKIAEAIRAMGDE